MATISGANVKLAMKREATVGVPPSGNWEYIFVRSFGLAKQQNFEQNDLVGQGSDPLRPARGTAEFAGQVDVPIDLRAIGMWLTSALGEPTTTDAPASGTITFSAQPAVGATVTIAGTAFAYIANGGTPVGNQIEIGTTLAETITNTAAALNASTVPAVEAATYAAGATALTVTHDTAGAAGNAFTLAASTNSNGQTSAGTLAGGGYQHVWVPGNTGTPTYSVERQHPDASGGTIYADYYGIQSDGFNLPLEPTGQSSMAFDVTYRSQERPASSKAGTPTDIELDRFSQYQNFIEKDGVPLAKVTAFRPSYANNNEKVRYVGGGGAVGDTIQGIRSLQGQIDLRFENFDMHNLADNETTFEMRAGFRQTAGQGGYKLEFLMHQVEITSLSDPIQGGGQLAATAQVAASKDPTAGKMLTVTLTNDVASYA